MRVGVEFAVFLIFLSRRVFVSRFRVPDGRTIVAFGQDKNTIIVVSADGTFYKAGWSDSGECVQQSYAKFIKSPEGEPTA